MTDAERAIREEARQRGLQWSDVLAAYQEVKETAWLVRERPNEIRQAAWYCVTAHTPKSQGFWRHGFVSRWGQKVAELDHTIIPGYDVIAQQIAAEFPEFAGRTEDLFAFLFSPHDKYPTRAEMLEEALDILTYHRADPEENTPCDCEF